jgi:hypothetical protein
MENSSGYLNEFAHVPLSTPSAHSNSRFLKVLTGLPCMTFILTVVFVDLIIAVCTFALDPSPSESRDVEIFGFVPTLGPSVTCTPPLTLPQRQHPRLVVVAFFVIEITLRMNTFVYVHGSFVKFFKDIFNTIDFVVVVRISFCPFVAVVLTE